MPKVDLTCTDVEGFIDAKGSLCSSWFEYNCTDVSQASSWGYTNLDMQAVATNCRASCDICDGALIY